MAKKPWDDKWENKQSLGSGGQGNTFLVTRKGESSKTYVLKVLKNQDSEERRARMYNEVKALRHLNHPEIPKIIETNADSYADKSVSLYFVAEHINGLTLEQLVEKGRLPPQDALRLTLRLAAIINYCHEEKIMVLREFRC